MGTTVLWQSSTVIKKVEETNTSTFKWYYHNSYNNKSGCATIRLVKTHTPEETQFTLQMSYSGMKVSYGGFVDVFDIIA